MLVGATALALAPAAFERGETPSPQAEPSASPGAQHSSPSHTVIRTLDFGGLHLTYAEVDGMPGPLYLVVGYDLTPPADAEKLDLDTPGDVDVWFVAEPASGEPQLYVKPRDSSQFFGIYGQSWTREQLVYLLEHPLEAQGIKD